MATELVPAPSSGVAPPPPTPATGAVSNLDGAITINDASGPTPIASTSTLPSPVIAVPAPPPPAPPALDLSLVSAYSTNVLPADYDFSPDLTPIENYMTLLMIYTRLSMSKRGCMACLIVQPDLIASQGLRSAIISHGNNTPLVTPSTNSLASQHKQPELHAEAFAITDAAKRGVKIKGADVYVTFPPCSACFHLLVGCGVGRMIYRKELLVKENREMAKRLGIELVELKDLEADEKVKDRAGEWWKERGETKEVMNMRAELWWASQGVVPTAKKEGEKKKEWKKSPEEIQQRKQANAAEADKKLKKNQKKGKVVATEVYVAQEDDDEDPPLDGEDAKVVKRARVE